MPEYIKRWHPFLGTDERTPGVWTLIDTTGLEYGTVRIVRVGDHVGYVAELGDHLVGRYFTLRSALEATHQAFVRSQAPGFQGYPKFTSHRE